jgi:hypothetical protein
VKRENAALEARGQVKGRAMRQRIESNNEPVRLTREASRRYYFSQLPNTQSAPPDIWYRRRKTAQSTVPGSTRHKEKSAASFA